MFLFDILLSTILLLGAWVLPTLLLHSKQTQTASEIVLLPNNRVRIHKFSWFARPLPSLTTIETDMSDCQLNFLGNYAIFSGKKVHVPWSKMHCNSEELFNEYESKEKFLFHKKYISRSDGIGSGHSSRQLFAKVGKSSNIDSLAVNRTNLRELV